MLGIVLSLLAWLSLPETVFGAEVSVDTTVFTTNAQGNNSSPTAVWITDQIGYTFYLGAEGDLEMASTTNGGTTWQVRNAMDSVNVTDVVSYAIWWDGWTAPGTTTQYIHIATTDTSVDDIYYTRLDINTQATSTTVVTTTQAATCDRGFSCQVSITKASNNVLYVATSDGQDSWVDSCSTTCTSTANWSERTNGFYQGKVDYPILMPVGGNNNVMLVSWATSTDSIVYNIYSATSSSWQWATNATQTIASSKDENTTYDGQLYGMSHSTTTGVTALALVDDANEYVTTQDHDVNFFTFSSTTGWVAKTDVVTDASGGLIGAKVSYDELNDVWYVLYGRRTTIGTATTGRLYFKTSTDGGSNWSTESATLTNGDDINGIATGITSFERIGAWWNYTTGGPSDDEYYNLIADLVTPPPTYAAVTLSGTLYSDDGLTPMTAGKTLKIAVGTTSVSVHSTTTTSATGAWSFIIPSGNTVVASTGIVVWIDGISTTTAVTFTKASTTEGTIPGLDLYQNRVIIRHEATTTSASTTISDMAFYDGDDDADIKYTANAGALQVRSGNELYIWAGKTFAPTSTVTINGNASSSPTDGSLRIMGTYTPSATTTVAGHFYTASSSTYTPSAPLVFTATSSGKYISHYASSSELGNVRFQGTGNMVFLSDNATTTHFSIASGTVTPPIGNLTVKGNLVQSGQLNYYQGGTLIFASSSAQSISGTMTGTSRLADVVIRGASTKTFSSVASTTNLTIESGSTLVAPRGLTLSGSWNNAGTFTASGGIVYSTGASSTMQGTLVGTSGFAYLEVDGAPRFGNATVTAGMVSDSGVDDDEEPTGSYSDAEYVYVTGRCYLCGSLGDYALYTVKYDKTTGVQVWATTTDVVASYEHAETITGDQDFIYVSGYCNGCGDKGSHALYTIKYRKSDAGFVWATTTDIYSGLENSRSVVVDDSFVYLTAGCDGCGNKGGSAIYIIKYRKSDAGFVWATTTDPTSGWDYAYSSTQDQDYLYATGICDACGTVGSYALYTIKYRKSDAGFVWATTTDPTALQDYGYAIVDDQDYVYVGGVCKGCGSLGNGAYYTIKYRKSDASRVWATTTDITSNHDQGAALAEDQDSIYLTGYCTSCGTLGSLALYTIKYTKSDGSRVWATTTDPSTSFDEPKSITVDQDYVYVFGYCSNCLPASSFDYYTIKYNKFTGRPVDGSNTFRFASNASTTGDFTITYPGERATNTVYAPASLTIGGDFNQYATFVNNSGIVTMSSSSAQVLRGTFATSSPFSSLVASGVGPKTFDIEGFAPVLESGYETRALTIDTISNVLYIGAGSAGSIWRCELSTGCDDSSDFTAYFLGYSVISLVFSASEGVSGVLYAGTDTTGEILRCDVSDTGGCYGSFTSVYISGDETITALAVDPVNGTLYATGGVYGFVYACYTATLCDESMDFYSSLDTSGGSLYALAIDPINRVLFVGSGPYGMVYACPLSSYCDESTDFTSSADTPSGYILSLTVDTTNGVLYAGADGGVIYRCVLSTGCDTGGDFTTVYDTSADGIYTLTIDAVNAVLYAGAAYSDGIVYRCELVTGCDSSVDFSILYDTPETGVYALAVDQSNDVLYIGTNSTGSSVWSIYRCEVVARCADSDTVIATNITVQSGSTLITPTYLSLSGNYTQNGTSTTGTSTSFFFTGSGAQTISGTLTATSALPSTVFTGAGVKTFSSNASTTGDFSIESGSSVTAPSALTVGGDFTQRGTFTHNSGTVYLSGMGYSATGTMTGSSAFNNLTLPLETGGANISTAYDTGSNELRAIIVDTTNRVLYVGGYASGNIYRCLLSTGCDASGDFTTAYATSESSIESFAIDTTNGTLYVGTGVNGIIYRCLLSTNCDASGDFTTAYDTAEQVIWSLAIDSTNNVLYASTYPDGLIYRCVLSTGCDAGGDFTNPYNDASGQHLFSLVIASSTLYFGSGNDAIIYRCLLSTNCDASGDFVLAYNTTESQIRSLAVDTINSVLYAGSLGSGIIYRCPLSSACDSAFDFTSVTTGESMIYEIAIDTSNGILYASTGLGTSGKIFRCLLTTGCDALSEFVTIFDTFDIDPIYTPDIFSTYVDPTSGTVYAGSDSTGILYRQGGGTTFGANASTSNLTITGKSLVAPQRLSISGNFTQNGTFIAGTGTTTFNGTSVQTATGTLASTSAFYNLELNNGTASTTFNAPFTVTNHLKATTPSAKIELAKGATTTLNTVNATGGAGTEVQLRSTTAGTKAGLSVGGAYTFTYANIKDSSATSTGGLLTTASSIDAGNTNGWSFPAGAATISSGANQTFALNYPTTSISSITITDNSTPSITAANDIRIKIATSTVRMLWDTSDTSATFGGTASGKVANPVTYEGGGSVLVIPVSSDFSGSDTLTISGLSLSQFTVINSAVSALAIYTGGGSDTVADANDDKTVTITGPLTLANHDSGQTSDGFTSNSRTGVNFFRYKLTPSGEDATISSTVFSLVGIDGIAQSDLSNLALYRDMNSDGAYAAGDTQVGGAGVASISGQEGTITFSSSYSATTSQNFILMGDYINAGPGNRMTIRLEPSSVTATGATTGGTIPLSGSITQRQHVRSGGGSTGGNGESLGPIGGDAPTSTPQGGGGGGGGGSTGGDAPTSTPQGGGGGGGGGEVSIPSSHFFASAYMAIGDSLISLIRHFFGW